MNKKFLFSNELLEEEFEEDQGSDLNDIDFCLTEIDVYFSFDNRVWTSNVEDIDGGDNFADYCKEFFEMLDEEEYYDN